jgi:hypothetical protein
MFPLRSSPRCQFAVCVDNFGYEASLERNKISVVLPDKEAERNGDIRVVDESGEDYLFSADRLVAIDVPENPAFNTRVSMGVSQSGSSAGDEFEPAATDGIGTASFHATRRVWPLAPV